MREMQRQTWLDRITTTIWKMEVQSRQEDVKTVIYLMLIGNINRIKLFFKVSENHGRRPRVQISLTTVSRNTFDTLICSKFN
jgi:hypothetical protein